MRTTSQYLITALFCLCTAMCSAQDQQRTTSDSQLIAAQNSSTSNPAEIKTDLERMQVLLGQMQRNVAFVSAGDTPLKHQFELEIQMWQLLIRDMEKKTQGIASR